MSLPRPNREGYSSSTNSEYKRLSFLKLSEGQHVVRILTPISDVTMMFSHWINRSSIECLGAEDCPICVSNQQILRDNDNDWKASKDVKGFNPYQTRYYVNVLDKTPVKVHPNSEMGFENKRDALGQYPAVCGDCGEPLDGVEVTTSNKVKVLNGGVTLFNDLENIDKVTLTDMETGEPKEGHGITNYDIVMSVKGEGRDRSVSTLPQPDLNDVVPGDIYELFDVQRSVIHLSTSEVTDFISGVSLKDIFASKKADNDVTTDVAQEAEAVAEVESAVADDVADLLDG